MHHHREWMQVIFVFLFLSPWPVYIIGTEPMITPVRGQTFATADANVINRQCKRLQRRLQTFAVKVHYWEADQGNG